MAVQYPDIISEYLDADQRYENNGVQIVPSLEPSRLAGGEQTILILLLQNTLDVPAEVTVRPELPVSSRIKGGPVLRRHEANLRIGLEPAQVGSLFLPLATTEFARDGEFEIVLQLSVLAKGGNRIRPSQKSGPLPDSLVQDVVGLDLGRTVGVAFQVNKGIKIKVPFSIRGQAETAPQLSVADAKFDSLWKVEDFDAQAKAFLAVNDNRAAIFSQLETESLYVTLFAEAQKHFAECGIPLQLGEAIALAKILTFTARYFLGNRDLQDGLLVPVWEIALDLDLPIAEPLWVLRSVGLGHLLRLSTALSFGLIAEALQLQPWDLEERRTLTQVIAETVEAGDTLPAEFLYIPLLTAAAIISRRLPLDNEDVRQSLQLLKKAKANRADVFDDPDLAQANQIFDKLVNAALEA